MAGRYNNYNSGRSYNNYGGRSGGFRPYNGNQRETKKHSGARFHSLPDDLMCVSGWMVKRREMLTVYARPYKGTKKITSEKGKRWLNLFVTITNKTTMQKTNTSGLLDVDRKRLYIKDYNLILTTVGNGGYCGTHMFR